MIDHPRVGIVQKLIGGEGSILTRALVRLGNPETSLWEWQQEYFCVVCFHPYLINEVELKQDDRVLLALSQAMEWYIIAKSCPIKKEEALCQEK